MCVSGFLIGGDVLRLLHGHMDECLTVPSGEHGEEQRRSVFRNIILMFLFHGVRVRVQTKQNKTTKNFI